MSDTNPEEMDSGGVTPGANRLFLSDQTPPAQRSLSLTAEPTLTTLGSENSQKCL